MSRVSIRKIRTKNSNEESMRRFPIRRFFESSCERTRLRTRWLKHLLLGGTCHGMNGCAPSPRGRHPLSETPFVIFFLTCQHISKEKFFPGRILQLRFMGLACMILKLMNKNVFGLSVSGYLDFHCGMPVFYEGFACDKKLSLPRRRQQTSRAGTQAKHSGKRQARSYWRQVCNAGHCALPWSCTPFFLALPLGQAGQRARTAREE